MALIEIMPTWQRLSSKIAGALIGFLMLALVAIGATLYLSWQLEGSSAAINEAGRLRMQNYRVALLLSRWVNEPHEPATRVDAEQALQAIDATFADLRLGNPQRPLFLPPTARIHAEFNLVMDKWQQKLRPVAVAILAMDGERRHALWGEYQPQVDGFVGQINDVVKLIEQDSEQRTFWLRSSQLGLVALALTGTVALIYLMFMLIVEPVTRLQDGMRRMTDQDFGVRVTVESRDEFGQLSEGFNQMADRLEGLYRNLESRVQQKTQALEDQNRELALLYDSAAFLQRPQPVEAICEGFLQRISQYFKADGGAVWMLDASRGNLHMVVHHGISEQLAQDKHCLKVGDCLCGAAVEKNAPMVYDLRRIDQAQDLSCRREGFATLSVSHIHAHQVQIGFFNLHFRTPRTFSKHEEAVLETLGQLLGVAIENLRLGTREREMAISEERNLVAQGLHDSIAQGLTFLNIQVQMLEDSLKTGRVDEVADIVPALRAGVQESYEDVRELLSNFRSRLAEGDLVRSLEATVEKFRRQSGIATELVADGDGAPFPREQQLQILFIVQEALSNVRKHAVASRVEIRLVDRQDFGLTIHDNGIGFDAETLFEKGESHIGINIMRERAQRIQASFDVASVPGKGTTVALHVPREQRRAA